VDWVATTMWWHCYVLGFVGAERRADEKPQGPDRAVHHRLRRLVPYLDYVLEIGANGLLLGPVFASVSHGYDTLDHYRIDPRLGDHADFDDLVSGAGERGVRLCLDGVFNHLSRDHEIVRRAVAEGPHSEAGRWVRWSGDHLYGFEGNLDLVELDLTHPPVTDYVVDVMTHWLDRGIDGWRLDAAFAAGAAAWRPIVERVKAAHPDCWIVAELLHGDAAAFVEDSRVDSVTAYELWKATWSSLNDRNFHELAWSLQRHAQLTATCRPQTFIGNHDVTRIASRLTDARHLPLAVAVLATMPGVPTIYAGDERGFTGVKLDQPGGDDAVRPGFPSDPASLAGVAPATFELHQRLLGLRRRHPWLVDARIDLIEVDNTAIAVKLSSGDESLTVALNVDGVHRLIGGVNVPDHGYVIA
jgi:cyclomaltodextrinase / maltogenic alpha-amylase / neopullulanase